MDESKQVEITTFINPHMFWIVFEKDKENRHKLEQILLERNNSFKEAHITEGLAVIKDKQTWKRILIKSFNDNLNKYRGWLIDYGKNLTAETVYELPKEFTGQPAIAQSACLYNTIPLKSVLDVEQNKCIYEKQTRFSEGTIKIVKDYIQRATSITFHIENIYGNILCGSLHLVINQSSINIIEILIEKGHVVKDVELFLQAMKINMEKILQNNVYSRPLQKPKNLFTSEGIGRGCLRNIQREFPSPGLNNTSYVPKWLLQNMIKAENTVVRRPARLLSFNDSNPNEPRGRLCSPTSSNDGNNKGDLKPALVIKNESYISPKANEKSSITARKDENQEESVMDKTQHEPPQNSFNSVQQTKNLNPNLPVKTKSHLPPSAIKQLYENEKGVKATLTSTQNSHCNAVKNINLTANRLIEEINLRKGLVTPIDRTVEIESIIRGRGKSKVFVPKSESNNTSNENEDSWEDIDENNSNSQDATDSSLTKFSLEEELHCDQIPKSVSNSSESDVEVPVECRSLRRKLKLGCQCENCLLWETNDFAEDDKQFADLTSKPRTTCQPPPFLKGESTIAPDTQMKRIERNQTKIQKDISPCLLVHSLQLPRYISDVADVAFCQPVHRALNHLKLKSVYTIQSYAWPAIMRLMNTCLVGAPRSGKSLCYLPAVCTFVIEKQSRYCELPKENSPIAIVICESAFKAEEIYNLFISILKYTHEKVAITLSLPPFTFHNLKCIKSCDILVATPRTVVNLIRSRHINLKRLCHFVVEDADKLLIKYENDFETLTKAIQSMLNHRVCFYGVQVITISECWTRNLETFLKKLDSVPIICISNFLQCAIYGQAKIQMHFVSSSVKIKSICDIVKESSRTTKTVIVCNDDNDVVHMSTLLQIEGASVTSTTSNMMADEIHEQELVWNSTKHGRYSVLVCTDSTLNIDLNLTQADMLIHYKLPQDHWTDFSKRFKCLLDNYDSPLNSKSSNSCKIHVYVSEECSKQYPRLYRFLTEMGLSLPPKFVELSMNLEMQEEQVKMENNSPVCKRLKLLGKCAKFRCNKRHILSKKLDVYDWIPASGIIKFQLLSVQDGSLFGVRLLEHIDTNRNLHKIVDYTEFIRYDLTRDVKNNKISAINVSVGELYAWLDDETDLYHRCKVLKIFNEFKITKEACQVLVKLIDIGKEKRVQTGTLCTLPRCYATLPPQSIDVYLANVLPLDEDEHWCAHTKNQVLGIMNSVDGTRERCYFSGRILLQIGETLWLDDIKLQEDLQYSNDVITIFSLKKKMLEKQLCSDRSEQLHGLYTICKNCNITLPNYEVKNLPEVRRTKQVEPQWAYLEDGYNVVYFCSADSPTTFYVRQEKYHKIFQQLQNEIQQMILNPFYPKTKDVLVNHCYLAQDPNGDEYGRVIVRNIQDEMVDCFFVDFGDSTSIQKDELKFLPDNIITRLPFQAIECSLFGVKPVLDSWPDEATDVLYDHCFELNTNIYKNLYVKHFKSIQSEHKRRNVYSVIVVDYVFEKPIFLNNVLVDCGFASLVKDELLTNLTLPDIEKKSKEDADEYCDIDNDNRSMSILTVQGDTEEDEEDIWDVQINDAHAFMDEWFGKKGEVDKSVSASQDESASIPNCTKPTTALPPVNYCTPDVVWYQTDHLIKVDIMLPGVEKYTATILKKSIFSFSTVKKNKEYKLSFRLFKSVNPTFQHIGGGPVVRVTLTKTTPVEWDRLTFSDKKVRYIKYNMSKCVFPEEKRLFLDIGKDDEEETNNDDIVIDIGSDDDYSESDIQTDFESD